MKKKILATLLAATLMISSLAGCGKTENPAPGNTDKPAASTDSGKDAPKAEDLNFNITVWVPENAVELTKSQIAAFNSSNPDGITFNATIEAVSEADSATTMINDVESGADIYFFAQDQAARLIQSGALSKLGVGAAQSVSEANAAGVVSACMSGEDMYAYPLTADNGYFMYYDKSVIPDSDIDSLEKLIAVCEAAGKTFCMETDTSAWYLAGFFFGTGCVSEWETDSDGAFISVNDTFNSDKGLIAAKGLYKLQTSPAHVSSSAGTEFDAAVPAAIVVTGTWDFNTVSDILGDNMGVADLPSFEVDGTNYHIGSYNGCKLLGVKPQTDAARGASIHKLAQYLVSEEAQLERFENLAWGPANLNAQASDAVQSNPGLAALLEQAPYSVPQGQIHGSWWDIAKVIGTDVGASDGTDAGLKAALEKYQATIEGLFNMSDEEKNAWSVIGTVNGTNWDTDFDMVAQDDGTFKTAEAFEMAAGTEFKVRQGKSWDVSFGNGGDNFVVEADGTYYVVFDPATETVSLAE